MERMRLAVSSPFQIPGRSGKISDAGAPCLQSPRVLHFTYISNGNTASVSPSSSAMKSEMESFPAASPPLLPSSSSAPTSGDASCR